MTDEVVDALLSALERTQANFVRAVNGLPVRDMAETLAENRAAIRAATHPLLTPRPASQEGAAAPTPIDVLVDAGLAAVDPAPFLRAISTIQETQRR